MTEDNFAEALAPARIIDVLVGGPGTALEDYDGMIAPEQLACATKRGVFGTLDIEFDQRDGVGHGDQIVETCRPHP